MEFQIRPIKMANSNMEPIQAGRVERVFIKRSTI